jgi:hypothetical protein
MRALMLPRRCRSQAVAARHHAGQHWNDEKHDGLRHDQAPNVAYETPLLAVSKWVTDAGKYAILCV